MSELPISPRSAARIRHDGRYGGRIGKRDAPLPAAPDAMRPVLAEAWWTQAATEARVAHSFALITRALREAGADDALVKLADRAVDDEHRHAALCEGLSAAYAGAAPRPYVDVAPYRPEHPDAPRALRPVLHVVGQCCFNETFAGAYLACASEGATEALARYALRELLADEIDHARIGWAFLQTRSKAERAALSKRLVALALSNLREWFRLDLPAHERFAAYGIPHRERVREALFECLRGVLIPGFAAAGLDTRALERFARTGRPDA
ncbi:MAG: hypothetical protein AAF411_25675 [Myxococcota bacterium]